MWFGEEGESEKRHECAETSHAFPPNSEFSAFSDIVKNFKRAIGGRVYTTEITQMLPIRTLSLPECSFTITTGTWHPPSLAAVTGCSASPQPCVLSPSEEHRELNKEVWNEMTCFFFAASAICP